MYECGYCQDLGLPCHGNHRQTSTTATQRWRTKSDFDAVKSLQHRCNASIVIDHQIEQRMHCKAKIPASNRMVDDVMQDLLSQKW